jgi:hypothetical protein
LQTGQKLVIIELKHFPSLDASSLDWMRDLFVLRASESAELNAAEDDELTEIRTTEN